MPAFNSLVVIDQVPVALTVVVPTTVAPSNNVNTVLASAVPLIVGVVSFVSAPLATVPCTVPTSSAISAITGAGGAVVSTVIAYGPEGALTTPVPASTAVAVKVCVVSDSALPVGTVYVQTPAVTGTPVATCTPSTNTFTVAASAGAVPLIVGVVSLVTPSLATTPVCGAKSSTTLVIVGTVTPLVSTIKAVAGVGVLTLPAGSVSVLVKVCGPSTKGVVGVNVHVPSGRTVVVPIGTPPSRTVIVLPGSPPPVPLTVGVLSSVVALLTIRPVSGSTSSVNVNAGELGANVSTVNGYGPDKLLVTPAGLVASTVMVCPPSLNGVVGVNVQLVSGCTSASPILIPPS